MKRVIEDVKGERKRQDEKWGEQNHGPSRWSDILMEEVGEVSKAILENCGPGLIVTNPVGLGFSDVIPFSTEGEQAVRKELVHVAAVAVAWIECIDRRNHD